VLKTGAAGSGFLWRRQLQLSVASPAQAHTQGFTGLSTAICLPVCDNTLLISDPLRQRKFCYTTSVCAAGISASAAGLFKK